MSVIFHYLGDTLISNNILCQVMSYLTVQS